MNFEVGQRVIFRSLQWEVEDTSSDTDVKLFGRSTENAGRHIRALLDVEHIERAELPALKWTIGAHGWDARQWKALHDAFRFTLAHSRGNLASVDWGRLVLEPYQLEPLQHIEQLPFPRLLLADDTGLGKTAEAGLIVSRLMQKRRADRVLILCKAQPEPERWQHELKEKFGIDMVVINDNADFLRLQRHVPAGLNVFDYYSRIVMSMHYAAQPHVMDDLRREVRWDVVIIDEAHHVAEREGSSKRLAELGHVVADKTEALLLLTATPHDGKSATYASLIRLLDPYTIVDPNRLNASIIKPLIVRRLKGDVEKADGTRFQQREMQVLDVDRYRSKAERSLDRGIAEYASKLKALSLQLKQQGQYEQAFGAAFLGTFFKKRLASSVYACRLSLNERLNRVKKKLAPSEDELTIPQVAQLELPESVAEITDEAPTTEHLNELQFPDGQAEVSILEDLCARAEKISEENESKVQALLQLVHRCLDNSQEKVVIFTEFRDTLDLLERILTRHGYGEMIVTYHGATSPAEREAHRYAFLTDPNTRIFLATDAASEGINLHKSCNTLIHVEIPWNPNRYEQRNGRIDRYGQQSRPMIYLLVSSRSVEQRMAKVVVEKLERIQRELGSVSNVFPITQKVRIEDFLSQADVEQINQHEQELGDSDAVNPAVEQAADRISQLLDTVEQEGKEETAQTIPLELFKGEQFGRQERLALEQQLDASRSFVPEYQDVEEFLRIFMTLPGIEGGRLQATREPGIWSIDVPRRLQQELRDTQGHPIERYSRATFQRLLAIQEGEREDGRRAEFLSPGHPLVQAALRYMRGCAFKEDFPSRIAYRRTAEGSIPGYIFTYAVRFVDGRGETIEERFETVFVSLDGVASHNPDEDMRLFTERRPFGNLSVQEESHLLPRFRDTFEAAKQVALVEMERRREERRQELGSRQIDISEEALKRLGVWKTASQEQIRGHYEDLPIYGNIVQLTLEATSEQKRRTTLFNREQERLESSDKERTLDIRAMREVRGESIDAIGALVIIPQNMS